MNKRRTQAERRQTTQAQLLNAARTLFGEKGYAETSLEDIATACELTVRPIYHYYKNKLGLFAAVVEQIERELIENLEDQDDADVADVWASFMKRCEDQEFRQIVLIDSPALLGMGRMRDGVIPQGSKSRMAKIFGRSADGLSMNMLMGALTSASLHIAENGANADDYNMIRNLIDFHLHPHAGIKKPR